PDPIIVVGRQNELVLYRAGLTAGLVAGAHAATTTVSFGDSTKSPAESGLLTTNPLFAGGPETPANAAATGVTSTKYIFVTHGLGLTNPGITADDPAYVQAVQLTTTGADISAKALGKLKIQQPRADGTFLNTRITGMTYAD